MTRDSKRAIVLVALLTLTPAASQGQVRRPQTVPPSTQILLRGFGDAGATVFAATHSFEAILGRPSGPIFGGGIELVEPPHWFLTLSASRFKRTGHRVFVFENQVFNLNVPTEITVTPLELTFGYRFANPRVAARATRRAVVPYAGGGVGRHRLEETSPQSVEGDDVRRTSTGYHVLGGVEIPVGRWLAVAPEAQWTSVPNALGNDPSGVSSVYNEHNLGGFTFRMKVVVGR